ncbi:MAG: hypothetical protein L0Y71_03465 [Gemmataceae bacterium]|nr:hypothetical protein [Gemmataceae bacterium]
MIQSVLLFAQDSPWSGVMGGALRGALIGAGIGAAVAVLLYFLKNKK